MTVTAIAVNGFQVTVAVYSKVLTAQL